jgi:hypothetical protein
VRNSLHAGVSGSFHLSFFLSGGAMQKNTWSRPVLVRKPVSETAQGSGSNQDGIGGEFPITS